MVEEDDMSVFTTSGMSALSMLYPVGTAEEMTAGRRLSVWCLEMVAGIMTLDISWLL